MEKYVNRPKSECDLNLVSDIDYKNVTIRKNIKGEYLDKDKNQLENHIIDLEETISINKDIISELLASYPKKNNKALLLSLNRENALLQNQLKNFIKQRDSCQSKLLIAEQIIAEYEKKESFYEKQMEEKQQELLHQLNKKEYMIQAYDFKIRRVVSMLSKYSAVDPEIRKFARDFNINEITKKGITNLVDENIALSTEVRTTKSKMEELESKLTEIVKNGLSQKSFQGWKYTEPIKLLYKKTQPVQRNSPKKLKSESLVHENNLLKKQIMSIIEENNQLKAKLQESLNKNQELLSLIFEMKKEISIKNQNDAKAALDDSFNNEQNKIQLNQMSFGTISSIRSEAINELFKNE